MRIHRIGRIKQIGLGPGWTPRSSSGVSEWTAPGSHGVPDSSAHLPLVVWGIVPTPGRSASIRLIR